MAVDFFSDSYKDARAKFLDRADAAGARLEAFENTNARGLDGERLFLDTAWFGDTDATTVLLNLSGTHGAEGFAGSAAQAAWIADGGAKALDGSVAMLMVHAANPFGFAHTLRCTEDNVDLNRNWIDHSRPSPQNALYRELHPLLCPVRIDEDALSEKRHGRSVHLRRSTASGPSTMRSAADSTSMPTGIITAAVTGPGHGASLQISCATGFARCGRSA